MMEMAITCDCWGVPPSYYIKCDNSLTKYALDSCVAIFLRNIQNEKYPLGYEHLFIDKKSKNKQSKEKKYKTKIDMSKVL